MTRFDSKVTHQIIRKIHLILADVESGEEVIDYLRSTEPIFMKEVGRFVGIELDKLKPDIPNDEDFLMYIGSILGAAYIMGFLIAREIDHQIYDGLIDLDSLLKTIPTGPNYVDKLVDEELAKEGKKKKTRKKPVVGKKKKPSKTPIKKSKKFKRLKIDFEEGEL